MNNFGERLKNLRKAAGITQQELADKLNVHPQTVSKWERGITEPDIAQLGELASTLGISLEKLLDCNEGEVVYSGTFSARGLGTMIYACRSAAGESQEQLGELTGVSADAVSRWERGVTCPDINGLRELAAHFKLPLSKLYYGAEEEKGGADIVAVRRNNLPVIILSVALALVCIAATLLIIFLPGRAPQMLNITVDGKAAVVEEGTLFMPETPVREGYDFIAWTDGDGREVTFPKTVNEGDKYNAVFTPHEYAVEYWLNGGYFENSPQRTFNLESGTLQLAVPQKAGQTFIGWHISPDYSDEPIKSIECRGSDVTLYAEWSDTVFTIEYELGGGILHGKNPQIVTASEKISLSEPVREGYVFLGWYDEPTGGSRYQSVGGEGALNLCLYALWQKTDALFAVNYILNDGSMLGENPVSVGAGEVHILFGASKTGYDFVGWNDEADGSGEYYESLYGISENLTLYAIFSPRQYLIRYEYDGTYANGEVNPNYITYGQDVTLSPVYMAGYEFEGWFTSPEGGEMVESIDETNILTITTLYARYKPIKYSITLDACGGIFAMEGIEYSSYTFSVTYDKGLILPECTLGGYNFLGWFDENGEEIEEINKLNICDMVLSAKWRASDLSYNITYVLDGGLLEEGNPQNVLAGQVIPLNEPVREGYIFLGWFDDESGIGNRYTTTPADRVTDLTLYAVWQEIKVSGSYENYTYERGVNSVAITGYTGQYGGDIDLIIPSVIDDLPVVEVRGEFGSASVPKLNSITIPEGIVSIGEMTFAMLDINEPFIIPADVEILGKNCFMSTTFFGGVEFAQGSRLKCIPEGVFRGAIIHGCPELPEGLQSIGKNAFYRAYATDICLPSTLESIADGALLFNRDSCDIVHSLYIPASVKYIGTRAINAPEVYFAATEEDISGFAADWYVKPAYSQCRYGVQPVQVTLHVGEESTVMHGNYFMLKEPYKGGYTFIGWQNGNGEYVRRNFATDSSMDLYAVFEIASATDGRSPSAAAIIGDSSSLNITLRATDSATDEFYFAPDVESGAIITLIFVNNSNSAVYYIDAYGSETYVSSGTEIIYDGGYFVCVCDRVFTYFEMSVSMQVISE